MSEALLGVLTVIISFMSLKIGLVLEPQSDVVDQGTWPPYIVSNLLTVLSIIPLTFAPVAVAVGVVSLRPSVLVSLQAGVLVMYYLLWESIIDESI